MASARRNRPEGEQQSAAERLEGQRKETERYRRAADDTLQQLDWCIGYLHGIRKMRISQALAHNRTAIRTNLLDRPEEPLPTTRTRE